MKNARVISMAFVLLASVVPTGFGHDLSSSTEMMGQETIRDAGRAPERARLVLFGEVFNLFNVANLVDYGGDLDTPAAFGRPGARFTQVFGSGGPRAFQFGARFGF